MLLFSMNTYGHQPPGNEFDEPPLQRDSAVEYLLLLFGGNLARGVERRGEALRKRLRGKGR